MQNGLVSIIIPTYNRATVLPETLDSLIAQTYSDWECIIVDDGSTDQIEELISSYKEQDSRFKFYKRPKSKLKGANSCRNYGFEKSNGEFLNWFDSDDIMHQDFIVNRLNVLTANAALDFCCCLYSTFTTGVNKEELANNPLKPLMLQSKNYIEDYFLHDLAFITDSMLWRKSFLLGKTLYDEEMHRAQEWDFHLRMLVYKPSYKYLEDILFYLRRGNESISTNATQSIKAQKSNFKYFNNGFNIVNANVTNNKIALLQYVFYRQSVNYYTINTLSKGILGRFKIASKYALKIFNYSRIAKTGKRIELKIILGIFVLLFTGKGFRYFHYPAYDKRTNKRSKKQDESRV